MANDRAFYVNSKNRIYLICSLIFLAQCVICAAGVNSVGADIASFICYGLLLYSIFVYQPEILSKYLMFIVMSSWTVVALLFLENGNVTLRGRHSAHYGSIPAYALGWVAFYAVIIFCENKIKRKTMRAENAAAAEKQRCSRTDIRLLTWTACAALFVLTACFISILNKPYFALSVDRFVYSKSVLPSYISMLQIWFYAFIPVVLMLKDERKWIPLSYLTVLSLLCLWIGEKFTGLIVLLYFIMVSLNPVYVGRSIAKKMRKLIIGAAVLVAGLLVVVFINQVVLYQYDLAGFTSYLGDRIAAQGELWWLTYEGDRDQGLHMDELGDELEVLVHQPGGNMPDYHFGIYKLMKKFMNPGWVSYALTSGYRATESARATFYYYGKTFGLVLGQGLLAAMICFWVNFCIRLCDEKRWLPAIPAMYIFRCMITAALMSDFHLLTAKRVLLMYVLLLLLRNRKLKFGNGLSL